MNDDLTRRVEAMNPSALEALEISGHVWRGMGFKSYAQAIYPQFDICKDPLPADHFDIADADVASKNVLQSLRPGGAFVISTPFLIKYHPSPLDNCRWSADGLKVHLLRAGFASAETWSWGNKACLIANLDEPFPIYDPARHSLENEPAFPLVVWGIARKR